MTDVLMEDDEVTILVAQDEDYITVTINGVQVLKALPEQAKAIGECMVLLSDMELSGSIH